MRQATSISERAADQRGMALLTGILLLMIMTVIGIASITLTGLESRLAGYVRAGEAATVAAESCLAVSVRAIEFTIRDSKVPDGLLDSASPAGPVPDGNKTILMNEIMGATGYEVGGSYSEPALGSCPNCNIGVPRRSEEHTSELQ